MTVCKVLLFVIFCYSVDASNVSDRYYPRYHLAPPHGWMNDPNGFCQFKNEYHLFYQFNPNTSLEPGLIHWGHAKSKDLFHWENLPIAMYPDQWYDKGGVFSGSAIVENNKMYLFYTGNVNRPGESPDHEQYQALAESSDGINVKKYAYNPIVDADDLQPNIRDPKVWKQGSTYYMVLGNSIENNTVGRALLFASDDKMSWEEVSVLDQSDGSLGYMWECPDFFELNGRFVLLFSPQGVAPRGDSFRNLFSTGYIVGRFDYTSLVFTPLTEYRELDHGHDFYATQTIKDAAGRRIVIAWLDMWETHYPEKTDGFTGQMTIPRVLSLTQDNYLIQKPVKEIGVARGKIVRTGKARGGTAVILEDNAAEIDIRAPGNKDFSLSLESNNSSATLTFTYSYGNGTVTLNRGGDDGIRRTRWRPVGKLILKAYVDASSVEVFLGEGEVTFSSRFFPQGQVKLRLAPRCEAEVFNVNRMKRTLYQKK